MKYIYFTFSSTSIETSAIQILSTITPPGSPDLLQPLIPSSNWKVIHNHSHAWSEIGMSLWSWNGLVKNVTGWSRSQKCSLKHHHMLSWSWSQATTFLCSQLWSCRSKKSSGCHSGEWKPHSGCSLESTDAKSSGQFKRGSTLLSEGSDKGGKSGATNQNWLNRGAHGKRFQKCPLPAPPEQAGSSRCLHHVSKLVQFCTNPDKIIQTELDHPITINGALFACMDSNDTVLDELAHLLMINRVFAAHNIGENVTFATR